MTEYSKLHNCYLPRTSTSIVTEAKRSFFPCKEEDKLLHSCKIPNQTICMQALHCVFLSLSFCQASFCSSTFQKYPLDTSVTPWRLCMKQDNWPIRKGQLKSKVSKGLISAPMPLYLFQMFCVMETLHFKTFPVVHSPNPDHDPLSPLYVVLELWNLFQWMAGTRFSRKCVTWW